jgi:DNA mismatch endonuclease (patch repair protein)
MQASGYREKAAEHLRSLNKNPERLAQISKQSKELWASSEYRAKMKSINEARRPEVLTSAANARGHIKSTFTKPHRIVESLLVEAGLLGFVREYAIGFYHIDEAFPDLKLAIEVDGCYWHGCSECGMKPRTDVAYLDKSKTSYLVNRGWLVIRIKEHEILNNPNSCLHRIREAFESCGGYCGP